MLLAIALSVLGMVVGQQSLEDPSGVQPILPSDELQKRLFEQCESYARSLSEENERLKSQVDVLKIKIEALEEVVGEEENDEDDEEEDEKDDGNEREEPSSKGLRRRRGAAGRCEGGILSAWACAPQCIFKLKGLCGLSLKSMCHC